MCRHDARSWKTTFDAIISVKSAGKITVWNPAAEETFGYTRALVIGLDSAGIFSPPWPAGIITTRIWPRPCTPGKARLVGKRSEMTMFAGQWRGIPRRIGHSTTHPNPMRIPFSTPI